MLLAEGAGLCTHSVVVVVVGFLGGRSGKSRSGGPPVIHQEGEHRNTHGAGQHAKATMRQATRWPRPLAGAAVQPI